MPVGDLGCPAGDGPAQFVDLGWAGFVLEVVGELQGVAERDGDAVDVVDAPYCLFGVPGGADFSVGVAGVDLRGVGSLSDGHRHTPGGILSSLLVNIAPVLTVTHQDHPHPPTQYNVLAIEPSDPIGGMERLASQMFR